MTLLRQKLLNKYFLHNYFWRSHIYWLVFIFIALSAILFVFLQPYDIHLNNIQEAKAQTPTITVSEPTTVLPNSIVGPNAWPDGTMAVIKNDSNYRFIGAGGSQTKEALGSLDSPWRDQSGVARPINGIKEPYNYAAGGPIFRDDASGLWIMIYHGEKYPQGNPKRYMAFLNLAKSTDQGQTWTDLGMILSLNTTYNPNCQSDNCAADMGGGAFLLIKDYIYVYYLDLIGQQPTTTGHSLAVARARVNDILDEAKAERAAVFHKYYKGAWTEPGIGGLSTSIEPPSSVLWGFYDLAYNTVLGRYIMVSPTEDDTTGGAGLSWFDSADGLNWGNRQIISSGPAEHYYVTIADESGNDSRQTGTQFYIYYTYSIRGGWERWSDAVLKRRTITINRFPPPPSPGQPPPSTTPPQPPIIPPSLPPPPTPQPSTRPSTPPSPQPPIIPPSLPPPPPSQPPTGPPSTIPPQPLIILPSPSDTEGATVEISVSQQIPKISAGLSCHIGLFILLIIITSALAYYGIKFFFSRGNPVKYPKAKRNFYWVLTGAVIALSLYIIILIIVAFPVYKDFSFFKLSCQ